ncbi:uncharacterized protein [Mytilus edulis]|uniref:uncharacterized protein n=1 Tax=Mytilus edulis TaxID=6550 RepID=UPI0039EEE2BF
MAAVIGARLSKDVIENLGVKRAVFWSDSQIVLHWLTSSKSLNKFVKNRVSEIKELSETHEWKYVPTEMNPADLQTRGLTASQFEDSTLWMNGPQWLTDECKWPTWTRHVEISTQLSNITGPKTHRSDDKVPSDPQRISQIIDMNRYSDLNKLLTVTGYIFVKELEHISLNPKVKSLPLVQQLRLYLDENGIIRCKGRIQNSSIDENAKFPILLPKNHKLTDFVIMDAHLRNLQTGVGQTITHIRQSYWIPAIRQCVNSVLRKCIQCQKIIGKPYNSPEPPPLPKDRVKDTIPFCTTGIDFAGPLHIKDTSTQPRKVYICLFTCACIRAIHLELVPDFSLNTFILAFRRFISRKGTPQIIYSDNAPTFVAASNALQSQLNLHINLKFIPKGAPWYGGWWERLIGLTKIEKFIKEVSVSQSKNQSALNPDASDFICNNPSVQEHSNQIIFNSEQTSLSQSSMPTSTVSSHYNKLPKLNLPTFGGNLLEWSAFWDSYNNSVHENPSLSDVQRFNYLKSQLYGEASQCISGMQMSFEVEFSFSKLLRQMLL